MWDSHFFQAFKSIENVFWEVFYTEGVITEIPKNQERNIW